MYLSLRYAAQLAVGDEVLAERHNDLIPIKVINIASFKMQGKHYFFI